MKGKKGIERLVDLFETDMIIKLFKQKMPQQNIRKILEVDMRRVTKITKFIKKDNQDIEKT